MGLTDLGPPTVQQPHQKLFFKIIKNNNYYYYFFLNASEILNFCNAANFVDMMLDPICVKRLLIFVNDRELPVSYCISYYVMSVNGIEILLKT